MVAVRRMVYVKSLAHVSIPAGAVAARALFDGLAALTSLSVAPGEGRRLSSSVVRLVLLDRSVDVFTWSRE